MDSVFVAIIEAMVSVEIMRAEGKKLDWLTILEPRRFVTEFRMQYMISLWNKQYSALMIEPNTCLIPSRFDHEAEDRYS